MYHLDTPISPSKYALVVQILVILITLFFMTSMAVPLIGYGIVFVVISLLYVQQKKHIKLVHLAEPMGNDTWQFLVQTAKGEQLWQGRVARFAEYPYCVAITAQITEPMPRKITWPIYQDSLDDRAYHRLKMLCRFY